MICFYRIIRIATSFEATVNVCHMGTCQRVIECSMCKCDSFTRLQKSSRSFQPSRSVWQGFSQSAVLILTRLSESLPSVSDPAEKLSQLPPSWLGMLRELDGSGGSGRGGEMGERRGVFSLQPALFSPLSPGHRTPAGTHLIMHTAWRRGHNGTRKKSVVWQVVYFGEVTS